MGKVYLSLFVILVNFSITYPQTIPQGVSSDSITVFYEHDSAKCNVNYYKPIAYDLLNSPILFAIHGLGMDGNNEINDLKDIADRRKALIVAPNMPLGWSTGYTVISHPEISPFCSNWYWLTSFLKQIYNHTKVRENRNIIDSYLIGFSAGGQFVTRYMLIRQGHADSIPIKMAVSSSPFYYTFCTDSLHNQIMYYPSGLAIGYSVISSGFCYPVSDGIADTLYFGFNCNEHILQYYNENYNVLIGTADTVDSGTPPPGSLTQGANRYERAVNFFHFSDSAAVELGTTLKWQYGEIPGVGHDEYLMYNSVLAGDSMPLAERLLFETPYHAVPNYAPFADFSVDTNIVNLPVASVQFQNNSVNCDNFLWDFGDGTTNDIDYNPEHTYTFSDTFTVSLTIYTPWYCISKITKKDLIVVLPLGINEFFGSSGINLFPNPVTNNLTLENLQNSIIEILNIQGQIIIHQTIYQAKANIDVTNIENGLYILRLTSNDKNGLIKFIKE